VFSPRLGLSVGKGELQKVEKHERKDCQFCPYECGEKVLRINMGPHKEECPKRPQPCEFAIYGCQEMVPFNKEEAHRKSHSQHHLTLVLSRLEKTENELQVAKQEVVSHQAKLCRMEKCVGETKEHCRVTEEALQQTKEELHAVQERCMKTDECLRQTEAELNKARNAIDTQKI